MNLGGGAAAPPTIPTLFMAIFAVCSRLTGQTEWVRTAHLYARGHHTTIGAH